MVEQSVVTLKRMLQRSGPFKEKQCKNIDCLVCSTGRKGSCRSSGVTYELVCQFAAISTSGKRQEVLTLAVHGGDVPGFTMNVTGTFHNDAMLRQITESVRINQVGEGQLINTKGEWSYFRIPRVVVTQS